MSNLADARMPAPDENRGALKVPERAKIALTSDLVEMLSERFLGKNINIAHGGSHFSYGVLTDISISNGQISLWLGDKVVIPYTRCEKISTS